MCFDHDVHNDDDDDDDDDDDESPCCIRIFLILCD